MYSGGERPIRNTRGSEGFTNHFPRLHETSTTDMIKRGRKTDKEKDKHIKENKNYLANKRRDVKENKK